MSLKTRRNKINKMVDTVSEIYRRNPKHRVYSVTSSTSQEPYQVTTDWSNDDNVLSIACELYTYDFKAQVDDLGHHKADYSKYICSQFLAVVRWAGKQKGKVVSFCESYQDAVKLLNFGGQLVRVTNLNGSVVWGTVR